MFPKAKKKIRLTGDALRRLMAFVRERDDENCVACGGWVQEGTKAHHEPFLSHEGEDKEEDLFSLCVSCHHRRHFGPDSREIKEKVWEAKYRLYGLDEDAQDIDAAGRGECEPAGDHEATCADPERHCVSYDTEDSGGRRCNDGGCSSPQDAGQPIVRVSNDIKDQGASGVKGAAERRRSGSRRSTIKARTTLKANKPNTNGLGDSLRGSAKDRKHHASGDAEPAKVRRKRGCWTM